MTIIDAMFSESFEKLPDQADVWIYAAGSKPGAEAATALKQSLDELIASWSSHGRRVLGARTVIEDRVVVLGAWVADGTISGCGIDKSLHALDRVAAEYAFDWVDGLTIVYRSADGSLETCTRSEFRNLAKDGAVDSQTPVIDLSVRRLGELRDTGLERPAGDCWHGKAFDLAPVSSESEADAVPSN